MLFRSIRISGACKGQNHIKYFGEDKNFTNISWQYIITVFIIIALSSLAGIYLSLLSLVRLVVNKFRGSDPSRCKRIEMFIALTMLCLMFYASFVILQEMGKFYIFLQPKPPFGF